MRYYIYNKKQKWGVFERPPLLRYYIYNKKQKWGVFERPTCQHCERKWHDDHQQDAVVQGPDRRARGARLARTRARYSALVRHEFCLAVELITCMRPGTHCHAQPTLLLSFTRPCHWKTSRSHGSGYPDLIQVLET